MTGAEKITKTERKRTTRGGRNLIILGVVSILVACATTGVSLAIYHNSGDIYLDRSRPGYLPDEEEAEEEIEKEEEYNFEKSGKIDAKIIDEYLEAINIEAKAVDLYEKPFDATVLSDEHLGITEDNKDNP